MTVASDTNLHEITAAQILSFHFGLVFWHLALALNVALVTDKHDTGVRALVPEVFDPRLGVVKTAPTAPMKHS